MAAGQGRYLITQGTILLIGSGGTSQGEIARVLTAGGFHVVGVAERSQALSRFYEVLPDLVILAQDLPLTEAEQLISRLRQMSHLLIVVLASGQPVLGRVELLEAGADAFIAGAPDPTEMVAQLRSLLRRRRKPSEASPASASAGDPPWPTARRYPSLGQLTPTESRLLSCFILNEGRFLSHAQLLAEVWGDRVVSLGCLKFYVRRLRRKLNQDPDGPGRILTQPRGYLFCRY